ncbi:hypothetical protein Tco_0892851 [Tanacetum coccineum]|uniref:Reverse transcriptase domain-containing protein n=1 Tax=Tanacetum coccineum TaxID=301880 RepID=A0ABQ5CDB1_9ASTR
MPPKRTSTSKAPTMTQAAIKKLVADSVTATLEAQAATMAGTSNPNRNTGPTGTPEQLASSAGLNEPNQYSLEANVPRKNKSSTFATGTLTDDALSWWDLHTLQLMGIPKARRMAVKAYAATPAENNRALYKSVPKDQHQCLGRAYMLRDRKAHQDMKRIVTAQVMKKKPDEKRLEDIPIVREFPEVFPENLPGLPSVRQVEFQIDLIPGATPVARAPYRLAPSEMQELCNQLQELSDQGRMSEAIRLTDTTRDSYVDWVIVDRLTKSAHFIPTRETDSMETLTSYHASIKAAPFEALYGQKCRSPVCWAKVGDVQLTGPEIIHETT